MIGTYSKSWGVAKRSLECITHSKINGLNKQIMLQHNKAGIDQRRVAEDGLEALVGLNTRDLTSGYLPIVGVELTGCRDLH